AVAALVVARDKKANAAVPSAPVVPRNAKLRSAGSLLLLIEIGVVEIQDPPSLRVRRLARGWVARPG
ncbi:MAG TPA: hypothetical protein DIC23_18195, partial [Planctomycetaceae bacterium]|nr:hypothetical protein [Planctomycetaceae bacterium]